MGMVEKFDNRVKDNAQIGELRYAQDQMFKVCTIKRWNVIKEEKQKQFEEMIQASSDLNDQI